MKKKHYELGQIPTPDDMNDQHLYTEEALGDLVGVMTGGLEDVLFNDKPPSVSKVGSNWQVSVPQQDAAIQGRAFAAAAAILNTADADKQVGVFFVLKQTDVSETRERLRDTGSTLVRENFTPVVRNEEASRVELTESGSSLDPPPPPILAVDDVGYLLLATIIISGGSASIVHNTAAVWNFPGGGMAVADHALTHLPTGADPIPVATLGGASGSTPGLMPAGSMAVVREAIQQILVSPLSPYLSAIISGDNSLTAPKLATLLLRHHASLEIRDVGGQKQLGIRFANGAFMGVSEIAARADHGHPNLLKSYRAKISITAAGQLGTLIEVAPFGELAEVVDATVFWSPPGMTRPVPGVQCGWFQQGTGAYVGVRPVMVGSNEVHLEIGNVGLVRFQDAVRQMIVSRFVSGVTWNSATGDGNTPTTGELYLRVVGV